MSCRKPDTSSLSSAKLAFGSVMSELLDSSSAGIPLPTHPRPVSSHIAAMMPDEASHPATASWEPCSSLPVAACHLHTPHPITSPRLPASLFPIFPFISRARFFKSRPKVQPNDLHALAHDSPTHLVSPQSSLTLPRVSYPVSFIRSHIQQRPHFEVTE